MCCVNNELTADPCMKYTNGTLCKSYQKTECRNSDVLQSMETMVRNGTDKGGRAITLAHLEPASLHKSCCTLPRAPFSPHDGTLFVCDIMYACAGCCMGDVVLCGNMNYLVLRWCRCCSQVLRCCVEARASDVCVSAGMHCKR